MERDARKHFIALIKSICLDLLGAVGDVLPAIQPAISLSQPILMLPFVNDVLYLSMKLRADSVVYIPSSSPLYGSAEIPLVATLPCKES